MLSVKILFKSRTAGVTSKSWDKLKNIESLLVKLRRKFKMVGRLQMIHDDVLKFKKILNTYVEYGCEL